MQQLSRFLEAQENSYNNALSEIKNGRKSSHWMWFIFPQLKGLGHSSMATFYGIENLQEAQAYLQHPVLGKRLIEISEALLQHKNKTALAIFGTPDDMKLKSCMTLFSAVPGAPAVFKQVLTIFYNDNTDNKTLQKLNA